MSMNIKIIDGSVGRRFQSIVLSEDGSISATVQIGIVSQDGEANVVFNPLASNGYYIPSNEVSDYVLGEVLADIPAGTTYRQVIEAQVEAHLLSRGDLKV
jgi:hypothetical protein